MRESAQLQNYYNFYRSRMLLPSAMPPPPSRREAFVSTNIAVIRFVVNFKPCNELQGAGDKIIGTVVVLARKTVPIF